MDYLQEENFQLAKYSRIGLQTDLICPYAEILCAALPILFNTSFSAISVFKWLWLNPVNQNYKTAKTRDNMYSAITR